MTWEKWEAMSTDTILEVIFNSLGETERINTLDGEVVSAYVVERSRT